MLRLSVTEPVLSPITPTTLTLTSHVLQAMKLGKWISFLGSVSSLAVMTVISVSIGAVFSRVRPVRPRMPTQTEE